MLFVKIEYDLFYFSTTVVTVPENENDFITDKRTPSKLTAFSVVRPLLCTMALTLGQQYSFAHYK